MTDLSRSAIQALQDLNGHHPGFRPAHAKGILLAGVFAPAPSGKTLTRAPHLQRQSTPVTVRFSDFAGFPTVADNDPNAASPRGMAVRFHLAQHVHTDIIAHSVNGFPTRTAQEFVEFLRAAAASGPDAPKPTPIEKFLGTHPAALKFVQVPKPIPTSFAKESFYAVNAYHFTNREGASRYGRYRIVPEGGNEYLNAAAGGSKSADFLFEDIQERITHGPVRMHILVQLAAADDIVDDSTVDWPDDRAIVQFGTVELTRIVEDNAAEQQHIIFDPIPRVDGIEPSGDPLLEPRAAIYLMSGRQRRAAGVKS
ncbi:MAG TPA: catalase family peroxidase [Bryobacteraceae bacterium]|nr:catalase family peroxidase [Bryobacteraceae bacterium]